MTAKKKKKKVKVVNIPGEAITMETMKKLRNDVDFGAKVLLSFLHPNMSQRGQLQIEKDLTRVVNGKPAVDNIIALCAVLSGVLNDIMDPVPEELVRHFMQEIPKMVKRLKPGKAEGKIIDGTTGRVD